MNAQTLPASPTTRQALSEPKPSLGDERRCPRCGLRIAFTGYVWEHCSSGRSGTLSCPRETARPTDPPAPVAETTVAEPATLALHVRQVFAPHAGTSGEGVIMIEALDEHGSPVTAYLHVPDELLAQTDLSWCHLSSGCYSCEALPLRVARVRPSVDNAQVTSACAEQAS